MESFEPPKRILLIKPSSLGDVIHTLPVLSALHHHWPEAEIRWLIHPAWRFLVEEHPGVDQTILFPRDKFRGPAGWLRSISWMRLLMDWKPDLAIDLQGLLRSALFARISGAWQIVGLSDAREGACLFYHKTVSVHCCDHAVTRYLSILDYLGSSKPERVDFELPLGNLPKTFDAKKSYIVLHPYARGEGKSLRPDQIRAFALGANDKRIVLVGRGKTSMNLPTHVEDWSNRTNLLELIGILRGASFIVSSDSGPMHLATALHPERTLAIHLWSDPLRVGPCYPESLVWKHGRIARVRDLSDEWRPPGRAPTESEMKTLGSMISNSEIHKI